MNVALRIQQNLKHTSSSIEYELNSAQEGRNDALEYVKDRWKILNLKKDQQLLVAYAWTTKSQMAVFETFPEVIFIDTTKDTNNEGRPLCTVTGMDARGKMFPILRAFLPHERGWIFNWLLNIVMPKLFSEEAIKGVKLIYSDGDSREISAIDEAIEKHFTSAIRGRCGWHIIDRGWRRRGPRPPKSKNSVEMKNYLEQEVMGEFKISYYLMKRYVNSRGFRKKMGSQYVKEINEFMREYLQGSLSHMLFYKRQGILHFHLYSSVVHEGTNRVLKHGHFASSKKNSLYTTTKNILGIQSNREDKYYVEICKAAMKENTWSPLPFAKGLSERGFNLVKLEYDSIHKYESIRVGKFKWLVTMKREFLKERLKQIHPVFDKLRTIEFKSGVFKCSCCHFEEWGVPCRHILHLLDSFPGYQYPTKNDVSARYWKNHDYFLFIEHEHNIAMRNAFKFLKANDVKGPSCNTIYFEKMPIVPADEIPEQYKKEGSVCLNYQLTNISKDSIENSFNPIGLRQNVVIDYNELDDSDSESSFDNYVDIMNEELDDDLVVSTQQMIAEVLLQNEINNSDSSDLEADFASNGV